MGTSVTVLGVARSFALVPMLTAAVWAQEGSVLAALEVVPRGEQIFNLDTGRTELPDGGEVIDQATGVRLVADFVSFTEGEFIEATAVEVDGAFGHLTAAQLSIDIAEEMLVAEGPLQLVRDALVIEADLVTFDAAKSIVRFDGSVRGVNPTFEAATMLLDTLDGTVLLVGPYVFEDGLLTLTTSQIGGLLELTYQDIDGVQVYDATTEVSAAVTQRFRRHLP